MPDPETRVTDRNEVAVLIGVVAKTLPEGPCSAETSDLDYKSSGLYGIEAKSTQSTAFTWRDSAGETILEIKVPDKKDAYVRYQRTDYDSQGRPDTREEFYSDNVPSSKTWYYDNGIIAQANYGTTYGYSPATHIVKYDRDGQPHCLNGFADYVFVHDGIYSGTYDGTYNIHGRVYSETDFKKHPEYLAEHSVGAFFGKIGSGLSSLFNGKANDDSRQAALPVDALIAAADKLSPDDKDRLASTLGVEKKKAVSFKL